jgi:pimeloyl-ACP methyl ester carboxylesterase
MVLILEGGSGRAEAPVPPVKVLQTPSGVRFGILGDKPAKPAPTLFVLATSVEEALKSASFNKVGHLLARDGCLCVALDVPCHGADLKLGEPAGLNGWRARLAKGDDLVGAFTKKSSEVLDYLIKEGYTAADRVAVCGTSRGGFIALHWAAAEPRISSVVGFAPVSDLLVLTEFRGMEKHAATRSLALIEQAQNLAGRSIWVCIGNNDARVGTDHLIAFTRKLVAISTDAKKPAPVELHVMPTIGHRVHDTAHDEAAAWIARQWTQPR